jgi:hypothetical protein
MSSTVARDLFREVAVRNCDSSNSSGVAINQDAHSHSEAMTHERLRRPTVTRSTCQSNHLNWIASGDVSEQGSWRHMPLWMHLTLNADTHGLLHSGMH